MDRDTNETNTVVDKTNILSQISNVSSKIIGIAHPTYRYKILENFAIHK